MTRFIAIMTLWVCALSLPLSDGFCTGINITNIQVGALSGGSTSITFDITWSNSWRSTDPGAPAPNNWDAAWVFVKFRKNGGNWTHASLNDTGHATGSGTAATIAVGYPDTSSAFNIATNPGVGVFIYRSGDGTGTFTNTGASLSWNYSQDGVTGSDTVDVRMFGIEMVYVPDGAFFAGGPGGTRSFRQGSSDTDPWYIGSEDAITTGGQTGSGTGVGETNAEYYFTKNASASWEDATGATFEIPATFPKGYRRFYIMKGEISQGQWVAFFNTLTSTQKANLDITASGKNSDSLTFRNNVSWSGTGDATLPNQGGGANYAAVAMNYISLGDQSAYLDWAGLRLMSELEYERAARGPYRVVSAEYAWGNTTITQATSISNPGTDTEAAQSAANCVYGNHVDIQGPMRVGAMAYNHSTRTTSGAGYYGVMDLSGNLWDRVLNLGTAAARIFESRYHGNGSLSTSGAANVTNWPSPSGYATGVRGGGWNSTTLSNLSIQDRSSQATGSTNARNSAFGGRGVRTAP